jgi:uncharacterized protein
VRSTMHASEIPSTVLECAPHAAIGRGRRRALGFALGTAVVSALPACGTLPIAPPASLPDSLPDSLPGVRDRVQPYAPACFHARRPDGAVLYLFGTLHIGLASFYPLPSNVAKAFEQSSRLAVEIDARKHWSQLVAGFRPYVRLPPELTLIDLFDAELLSEIRDYFKFTDEQWTELLPMQPWWVANFRFGTPRDSLEGVRAEYGVEQYLLGAARQRDMAIVELERPIDQVLGLAGGSLPEQCTQLRNWFALIKRRGGLMSDLMTAWRRGDLTALSQLKAELWGDDQHQTSLRTRFFSDRDTRMAEQLSKLAVNGQPIFVAVGAYHLVDEDSLLAALRQRGFDVEQLDHDASSSAGLRPTNSTNSTNSMSAFTA